MPIAAALICIIGHENHAYRGEFGAGSIHCQQSWPSFRKFPEQTIMPGEKSPSFSDRRNRVEADIPYWACMSHTVTRIRLDPHARPDPPSPATAAMAGLKTHPAALPTGKSGPDNPGCVIRDKALVS